MRGRCPKAVILNVSPVGHTGSQTGGKGEKAIQEDETWAGLP